MFLATLVTVPVLIICVDNSQSQCLTLAGESATTTLLVGYHVTLLCILQIGADHLDVKIDPVVNAMAALLSGIIGHTPRFRVSP